MAYLGGRFCSLLPFSVTLACTTQPLTSFGVRLPRLPLVEWVPRNCRSFTSLKDHATALADQGHDLGLTLNLSSFVRKTKLLNERAHYIRGMALPLLQAAKFPPTYAALESHGGPYRQVGPKCTETNVFSVKGMLSGSSSGRTEPWQRPEHIWSERSLVWKCSDNSGESTITQSPLRDSLVCQLVSLACKWEW